MPPARLFPVEATYNVLNRYLTNLDGRSYVTGFVTRFVDPRNLCENPQYLTFDIAFFSEDSGNENRLKIHVTDPELIQLCYDNLKEGMEITAAGKLSVYAQRSHIQLNCETLEIHPIYLKPKMPERRSPHPLPRPCTHLALISSLNSETLADFQRYEGDYLANRQTFYPISLEAPDSPQSIASLIDAINQEQSADLIALIRGGGDTYAIEKTFSSPILCKAVSDSSIPVVTGIGHDSNHPAVENYADASEATPSALAARLNRDCTPSLPIVQTSPSPWSYLPLAVAFVVAVIMVLLMI